MSNVIDENITPQIKYLIRTYGEHFNPKLCPADIVRGRIGDCYDTCVLNTLRNEHKYRYVEGIATPADGKPRLHAWLTDGIHAFDPTWFSLDNKTGKEVIPDEKHRTQYVGVSFEPRDVWRFVQRTGNKGIFVNISVARILFMEILHNAVEYHAKNKKINLEISDFGE